MVGDFEIARSKLLCELFLLKSGATVEPPQLRKIEPAYSLEFVIVHSDLELIEFESPKRFGNIDDLPLDKVATLASA